MEQLTITLPEEIATQLKDASKKVGVKPEDFMLLSLQEKLAQVSESDIVKDLNYKLPHGDNTVRGALIFFAYHEAWHLGQIAYIRRSLGMEGLVPY